MIEHDLSPDRPLTPEQERLVRNLSPSTIRAIDEALLAHTTHGWRKVARVVGSMMMELPDRPQGIPDVYYSQRVARLVEAGYLEAQGDLSRMRYSEVRRAGGRDAGPKT